MAFVLITTRGIIECVNEQNGQKGSITSSKPTMILFVTLQRFHFEGTLGTKGMLASDWLLPCVKFCAESTSFSKRWVCHFFFLRKLTFLRFLEGLSEFQNSRHRSHNKSEETHNKLQKCQFSEWKKVTNPLLWKRSGFCTKLDTRPQPIRSKCTFKSKGPLKIKPFKRVMKSIIAENGFCGCWQDRQG